MAAQNFDHLIALYIPYISACFANSLGIKNDLDEKIIVSIEKPNVYIKFDTYEFEVNSEYIRALNNDLILLPMHFKNIEDLAKIIGNQIKGIEKIDEEKEKKIR